MMNKFVPTSIILDCWIFLLEIHTLIRYK